MTELIEPGGGEVVGDSPERRIEILSDHEAVHATWTRYGPYREGADLHVHRRHTDLFYVLEGELTVLLGPEGEPVAVSAGTLVRVPPLVVHGFRNGADAELRYLNFHAPGERFADFLRALRDGHTFVYDQEPPPADGGRPMSEAVIGGDPVVADGVARAGGRRRDRDRRDDRAVVRAARPRPPRRVALRARGRDHGHDRSARAACHRRVLGPAPAGVPHAIASAAGSRALEIHTPGSGFGGYLRGEPGFDQRPAPAGSVGP